MNECFSCFTFSLAYDVVNVLGFGHSETYVVASCCIFYFPMTWCGAVFFFPSFHACVCHLEIFFGEVWSSLAHFLKTGLFACWDLTVFVYFRYESFVTYMFYEYFLPVCGFLFLSFHSLNSIFWRAKVFSFDVVQFIHFLLMHQAFSVISKKFLPK